MRVNAIAAFTLAAAVVAAGCHSGTLDPSEFRYALDDYYRTQPHCLWSSPVNFPTEADSGNPVQARQLKVLTDAGVLERRTGARGGATVTEYSLSALGKTQWSADAKEPGWGNFCFARAQITSIDSINPPTPASVAYTIAYHYGADVPGWVKSSAVQAAFPNIAAEASGAATATLARVGTEWQVQNVTPAGATASGR
ncbi:MAG: hypothetical protein WAL75_15800 [Terracidiphilus sp.]